MKHHIELAEQHITTCTPSGTTEVVLRELKGAIEGAKRSSRPVDTRCAEMFLSTLKLIDECEKWLGETSDNGKILPLTRLALEELEESINAAQSCSESIDTRYAEALLSSATSQYQISILQMQEDFERAFARRDSAGFMHAVAQCHVLRLHLMADGFLSGIFRLLMDDVCKEPVVHVDAHYPPVSFKAGGG